EILAQIDSEQAPTHVFIQGGVGALAAAVPEHLNVVQAWRMPQIVVVEADGAACLFQNAVTGSLTAAPGNTHSSKARLCCGEPSRVAWRTLEQAADFFVSVPDDVVSDCMRLLALSQFGDRPIVAGESAIAGLAGFLCTASDPDARTLLQLTPDSRVLLFG